MLKTKLNKLVEFIFKLFLAYNLWRLYIDIKQDIYVTSQIIYIYLFGFILISPADWFSFAKKIFPAIC